ncbi:MAG: SsrA-binding protein SmpB [Firmicutes bacterium]|nr:SsrA-binding protein SmpB [Bacillota bacterium]
MVVLNMIEIKNKKASFDYFIEEEIECGIVLKGTEIKSIRNGQANIKDCYAIVKNNEVFLLNMYIAKYNDASIFNHDERRTRKLLLNKKEILKLRDKVEISGYTLVPLKLYFKGNRAKILLGVCKGKKNYDKRESIKEKDVKREIEKSLKNK